MTELRISPEYYQEVALGRVPGVHSAGIGGHSSSIDATIQTIWEENSEYVYLTEDTQLYISSSDPDDIGQVIYIPMLDDNYNPVTRLGVLNGQNQVAISGQGFRMHGSSVYIGGGPGTPTGDVYIAESDTLTNGRPNTQSKIKSKIVGGFGESAQAIRTVPANTLGAYFIQIEGSTAKAKDAQILVKSRYGGNTTISPPFEIFQNSFNSFQVAGFLLPETMDIEFAATSETPESRVSMFGRMIFVDN